MANSYVTSPTSSPSSCSSKAARVRRVASPQTSSNAAEASSGNSTYQTTTVNMNENGADLPPSNQCIDKATLSANSTDAPQACRETASLHANSPTSAPSATHQQQQSAATAPNSISSPNSSSNKQQHQQPADAHVCADYLAQLIKDKKQLSALPAVFMHVQRLVDEEIAKVRQSLFQLSDVISVGSEPLELPEPQGSVLQLQEKVYVPVGEHPEYNFVGRLLGPRGMTAKQLEQETGCKIMIRGKGSMRDRKKEDANRGKANWEHLNDELHVLITVEDTENRARAKLRRALDEVRQLLVPIVDGEDELKKRQLMELAIINGTYRDCHYNDALAKLLNEQAAVAAVVASSPSSVHQTTPTPVNHRINQQSATAGNHYTRGVNHQQQYYAQSAAANGSSVSSGVPSTGSNTPNSVHGHQFAQQLDAHRHQHQQQQHQQHHQHQNQHHHHNPQASTATSCNSPHQHRQSPHQPAASGHTQHAPAPPPPPPPPHLVGGIPPRGHHLTAAPPPHAGSAMAAAMMGGAPTDAGALIYAQQYHYAAMAAAAAASHSLLPPDYSQLSTGHHPHQLGPPHLQHHTQLSQLAAAHHNQQLQHQLQLQLHHQHQIQQLQQQQQQHHHHQQHQHHHHQQQQHHQHKQATEAESSHQQHIDGAEFQCSAASSLQSDNACKNESAKKDHNDVTNNTKTVLSGSGLKITTSMFPGTNPIARYHPYSKPSNNSHNNKR